MKTFPILYKKTSTGAIQEWTIGTDMDPNHSTAFVIWTVYGQVNGQLQKTIDYISRGKNIGKTNETSIEQQANAEAQAKWEKKLKSGYVESIKAAEAGEL